MRFRLLLCCTFLCLVAAKVQANIIVVTTTADAGAGSLRQAILTANANGTAETDSIHFNLPQPTFTQRIIYLINQLPPLTSNIVIDGTTQPGLAFGNTDAKVCIMKDDYSPDFTLFNITAASQVKIYGLYMYYGYYEGFWNAPLRSNFLFAIQLFNVDDIEIGAPGKGNVINGYNNAIYSVSDFCRNVRISSNYIGQGLYYADPTQDVDDADIPVVSGIHIVNGENLLVGGPTPAEGNVIKADRAIGLNSYYNTDLGFIRIENNVIGKYYDRTRILGGQDNNCPSCANVFIGPNQYLGPTGSVKLQYDVSILNNDIPTSLGLSSLGKPFVVKGNKFDLPPASALFTSMPAKLTINYCDAGIVGGGTDAESNSFRQGGVTGIYAIHSYDNVAVTISKNNYECNVLEGTPNLVQTFQTDIPFVRVNQSTATLVSGIATPNCVIELFYDDDCQACEGRQYIGATTSDAAGDWSFSGSFTGTVIATATTAIGATGEFSVPITDVANAVVKHPSCGQTNGSITGLAIMGGDGYMWRDRNGNVISNTLDLVDVGPGQYIFYAKLGNNCIRFGAFFELIEGGLPPFDTTNKVIVNPECGMNNGSIDNIQLTLPPNSVIEWQNDRGQLIPGGEVNGPIVSLKNLYPGRYRLFIRDMSGSGCNDSTFFYELTNAAGPFVDTNTVVITPASCGANNGSITNISLAGLVNTPFIQWVDSLNVPVGHSLDLMNQRPGKYRMKFKEGSSCDTTYTPYFIIPEVNISLDSSQLLITQSSCTDNNGSIEGMVAIGATGYRWINLNTGNQVSVSLNLYNIGAGTYQLEAYNNAGCTVQSNPYTVTVPSFVPIGVTSVSSRMASCNENNAMVKINRLSNDPAYFSFHWLMDSVSNIGTSLELNDLSEGRYQLIATDSNGCEKQIFVAVVSRYPAPEIDASLQVIKPDTCHTSVGSISNTSVTIAGGSTQYNWYNGAAQKVGQQPDLKNVPEGDYYLEVTDQFQCKVSSEIFTVGNISKQVLPPAYAPVSIPTGTPFILEPAAVVPGTYILYNTPTGGTALQQSNNGIFQMPGITSDVVYFIELQQGECVSARVPVEIRVVNESKIVLPNAFSPNGDGNNETWGLKVFGIVKLSYLRVFNRWGQVVFETNDTGKRWDGKLNGNPLPVGTYYYVLKAVDHLGKPISQNGPVLIVR